jgi:hypothetical protein
MRSEASTETGWDGREGVAGQEKSQTRAKMILAAFCKDVLSLAAKIDRRKSCFEDRSARSGISCSHTPLLQRRVPSASGLRFYCNLDSRHERSAAAETFARTYHMRDNDNQFREPVLSLDMDSRACSYVNCEM